VSTGICCRRKFLARESRLFRRSRRQAARFFVPRTADVAADCVRRHLTSRASPFTPAQRHPSAARVGAPSRGIPPEVIVDERPDRHVLPQQADGLRVLLHLSAAIDDDVVQRPGPLAATHLLDTLTRRGGAGQSGASDQLELGGNRASETSPDRFASTPRGALS
jgi:hypothetical protein